ncbi:nitronate monooxygenase [Streptomyces sp. A1-5]|nr:nitronate monooxygenase [Streptomyces sp. A1-5]
MIQPGPPGKLGRFLSVTTADRRTPLDSSHRHRSRRPSGPGTPGAPSRSRCSRTTLLPPGVPVSTETILGVSPFGEPDPRLVAAICRAGGLGVLDLGRGRRRAARAALQLVRQWVPGPFGVRVGAGCALGPDDLAADGGVHTVLLDADAGLAPGDLAAGRHRVLAEVTGYEEALAAARAGAHGLVARGNEAGGRVGELSTFVLLQQLVADPELGLPVWACGGIGPHTAAAAVVGGAAGVVLDTQLAVLDESGIPEEVAAAVRAMDGSETVVAAGHRVLRRRGPDAPPLPDEPGEVARLLGADDPRTRLLPVGQDGFLASSFARRWGDVGTAVRGVTSAIQEAVRDDDAADALLRRSLMSRALGTALPIAQGPMTRVSDRAGFAATVAGHGGLPFLALALAGPVETRTLLEQTRDELGGRPWGVGILGFAPAQVKTAQLELVRKIRTGTSAAHLPLTRPGRLLVMGKRLHQRLGRGGEHQREQPSPQDRLQSRRTLPHESRAQRGGHSGGRRRQGAEVAGEGRLHRPEQRARRHLPARRAGHPERVRYAGGVGDACGEEARRRGRHRRQQARARCAQGRPGQGHAGGEEDLEGHRGPYRPGRSLHGAGRRQGQEQAARRPIRLQGRFARPGGEVLLGQARQRPRRTRGPQTALRQPARRRRHHGRHGEGREGGRGGKPHQGVAQGLRPARARGRLQLLRPRFRRRPVGGRPAAER